MGPDPLYNTGVCRIVWSGGEISKESQANLLVQCIFSYSRCQSPITCIYRGSRQIQGTVFFQKCLQVDGWGKKGPSPLLGFLSSLWLVPGLRLMLGRWPSCGVQSHRPGTPNPPEAMSLPAACSSGGSPRRQ